MEDNGRALHLLCLARTFYISALENLENAEKYPDCSFRWHATSHAIESVKKAFGAMYIAPVGSHTLEFAKQCECVAHDLVMALAEGNA